MNNALNTSELPRFGIEIETVGLSRTALVQAIGAVVGGTACTYTCTVTDSQGRVWRVVPDGSLSGILNGEIVSPILTYADLELLQNVIRGVRAAGARTDESCGIHIHVDGARFDGRTLLNLVNLVHKHERLIEKSLGVSDARLSRYCQSIDQSFVSRVEAMKSRSVQELGCAWYGAQNPRPTRYDGSRYHGLNLNSFFYRGTIEFRYFNGTMHAGEVKGYVQLVLALAARALSAKATSRARRSVDEANEKWQFRVFLKNLGLVGPEFETARFHLTKRLNGTANRKVPSAA